MYKSMNEQQKAVYEEYKWARSSVQLTSVCVTEMNVKKNIDDVIRGSELKINILKRAEIGQEQNTGYVKFHIEIIDKKTNNIAVEIDITCKGLFEFNSNIESTEYEKIIDIQVVPQLYPFIRSAVNMLSSMMEIPTIILPTIDIINGLINNSKR